MDQTNPPPPSDRVTWVRILLLVGAARVLCAVCGPNTGRTELVGFGFDSNYFGTPIATHYASAHYQLQTADSVQQERPVHRQLNLTAGKRKIIGFKKDATAADVERSAGSVAANSTLIQQLVLEC